MKHIPSLLLSMAAAAAAGLATQDPQPTPQPAPPAVAKEKATPAPAKDVGAWIQDLGSDSYRTRLDAERALRKLGEAARPALEQAAASADDAEVQWRARRLVRQLGRAGDNQLEQRDRKPEAGPEPEVDSPVPDGAKPREQSRRVVPWFRSDAPVDPDGMRDRFDQLFEQFERDFGVDIPRARFFQDDFFKDLQDQLGKGTHRGQGMSMQIGPDGAVKVQVQEKGEDGKVETKTYEAPDLETFQKNHSDVLQQNGLGMGLLRGNMLHGLSPLRGFRLDGPHTGGGWQVLTPGSDVPIDGFQQATPAPTPPPAGKRLGISIREAIPDEVRSYLELDDGVGLQVESVSPGSLAEALGLQRGDIVTHVAKKPVGSPQDVQQALGPIAKGDQVVVEFVRKGVAKTATAAKSEANEEPTPLEKAPRLEKRRGTGEIR
ncbi:MAG: PDZ domain-containing protein [Planctomycetes bacterium]|nr:PDZ domain-containing protein [Planctomycetota bacterium]